MKNKMMRSLFSAIFLLILTSGTYAQNSLVFCLGVDSLGNPIDSGEAFSIPREGAAVNLLINLKQPVNTDTVQIDVYRKQSAGSGDKYLSTFNILVGRDYTSFVTDYNFKRDGIYYFYVFGYQKQQLAFGQVSIEYAK